MTITYLGQCAFLLEFDSINVVTDPYLSDYVDKTATDEQTKWVRLYPAPGDLSEYEPDLVLISHSHGDHMDPWTLGKYIEAGGAAIIAAPAPECQLLDQLNVKKCVRAEAEKSFTIADVEVTPIACAHTDFHQDDEGRYRELSYLIESGNTRVFFGGDMSLHEGLMERLKAAKPDLLLLPVNGRDEERTGQGIIGNINEIEAAQIAKELGAPYIAMHHDLYEINGVSDEHIQCAAKSKEAQVLILKPGMSMDFIKPI